MKYCTAADLIETLYRGLADNSVSKIIDTLSRNDLIVIREVGFAPLDDTHHAVGILDRLLHHATVVTTHGESRRMQDARNHREAPTNT